MYATAIQWIALQCKHIPYGSTDQYRTHKHLLRLHTQHLTSITQTNTHIPTKRSVQELQQACLLIE